MNPYSLGILIEWKRETIVPKVIVNVIPTR